MLFAKRKALPKCLFGYFRKSNHGSPATPARSATHAARENMQAAKPPLSGTFEKVPLNRLRHKIKIVRRNQVKPDTKVFLVQLALPYIV